MRKLGKVELGNLEIYLKYQFHETQGNFPISKFQNFKIVL